MEQALTNASLDGYVHFAKVIIVLLALVQHEESGLPKIGVALSNNLSNQN
jgi:hypothetical protein